MELLSKPISKRQERMSVEEVKEEHKRFKNNILRSIDGFEVDQISELNPDDVDITNEAEREDIQEETTAAEEEEKETDFKEGTFEEIEVDAVEIDALSSDFDTDDESPIKSPYETM